MRGMAGKKASGANDAKMTWRYLEPINTSADNKMQHVEVISVHSIDRQKSIM